MVIIIHAHDAWVCYTAKRHSTFYSRKIELITSYHNSDSESNDEESPLKAAAAPKPPSKPKDSKETKRQKKPQVVEYGPALPPNQNYTVPIGPELPPQLSDIKPISPGGDTTISSKDQVN